MSDSGAPMTCVPAVTASISIVGVTDKGYKLNAPLRISWVKNRERGKYNRGDNGGNDHICVHIKYIVGIVKR